MGVAKTRLKWLSMHAHNSYSVIKLAWEKVYTCSFKSFQNQHSLPPFSKLLCLKDVCLPKKQWVLFSSSLSLFFFSFFLSFSKSKTHVTVNEDSGQPELIAIIRLSWCNFCPKQLDISVKLCRLLKGNCTLSFRKWRSESVSCSVVSNSLQPHEL